MKNRVKRILDVAMTLALGCLMAYSLVGELAHEILGLTMLALLILHHALNGGFHRALFRGRYTPYRAALTLIDALMLVLFAVQGASGLMMARHVRLIPGAGGAAWARTAHLLGAYWGFALSGVHAGLHMTGLVRKWKKSKNRPGKTVAALAALGGVIYGGAALGKRSLWDYMTLKQSFVFFDYGEPLWRFFLDYAFILWLFMALGCALGVMLQKLPVRRSKTKTKREVRM